MKILLTLSLMLPLFGCLQMGTRARGNNEKPDGAVISYEYQRVITMIHPTTWYEVKRDAAGTVRIAWSANCEPDITVIRGPEDFFDQVGEICREYKLHRLKQSYVPRMKVLDGYMWNARIRFEKGSIYTGGSNAQPPEKLREGLNAINSYIQSIIDTSTEADVLERSRHE